MGELGFVLSQRERGCPGDTLSLTFYPTDYTISNRSVQETFFTYMYLG